jgi:hypothetical protein
VTKRGKKAISRGVMSVEVVFEGFVERVDESGRLECESVDR